MVYLACLRAKIPWKSAPYILLGDDILIGDHNLALHYHDIITKELRVNISGPKSFISDHFFEFAKRLFWKGEEITPFPISSLKENTKNFTAFINTLLEIANRGWTSSWTADGVISEAYAQVIHLRSKLRNKMKPRIFVASELLQVIRGSLPAGPSITEVFSRLGFTFEKPFSDHEGNSLIENSVVDLFSSQAILDPNSKSPDHYFDLAANLVMLLTSDPQRSELGFNTIYALPHTAVFGQIEETYVSLITKAREFSIVGDWPLLFKTMAIPISDMIFVERSAKTVTRVSSKLVDSFKAHGHALTMYPQLRGMSSLSRQPVSPIKEGINILSILQKFIFGVFSGIGICFTTGMVIKSYPNLIDLNIIIDHLDQLLNLNISDIGFTFSEPPQKVVTPIVEHNFAY